ITRTTDARSRHGAGAVIAGPLPGVTAEGAVAELSLRAPFSSRRGLAVLARHLACRSQAERHGQAYQRSPTTRRRGLHADASLLRPCCRSAGSTSVIHA